MIKRLFLCICLLLIGHKAFAAMSVHEGTITQPTSTGNVSYTGVGFQPLAVIFLSAALTSDGSASTGTQTILGIGVSSTVRASAGVSDIGGTVHRWNYNNKVLSFPDSAAANLADADVVSMDSDGFTLNWTTADSHQRIIKYIALGGSSLTNATIKQIAVPASTGNVGYTAIGFKPDALITLCGVNPSVNTNEAGGGHLNFGFGVDSTHRGTSSLDSSEGQSSQLSTAIITQANGSAVLYNADLVSMDSDGFTLNWTAVNSGRICYVLALKGGNYAVGQMNQPGSTGNQASPALGFGPSGIILSSINFIATSSVSTTSARLSIGLASGTSNRGSSWNNHAVNIFGFLDATKTMIFYSGATPSLNAAADLASFDSNTFTLNWTTADATAREINYLAFGPVSGGGGGGTTLSIPLQNDEGDDP